MKEKQKEAQGEVEKLHAQQDLCRQAVQTKNNEFERLLESQYELERQVEALQAIIKGDQAEGAAQKEYLDGLKSDVAAKPWMAEGYDRAKRVALKRDE